MLQEAISLETRISNGKKLCSSCADGGTVPCIGQAALPYAAGELLVSAFPELHAAQAPATAVVSGPQPPEAVQEVVGRPTHHTVLIPAPPRLGHWEAGATCCRVTTSI